MPSCEKKPSQHNAPFRPLAVLQDILKPPSELQKVVGFLLIFGAFQSVAPQVDSFKGFGSKNKLVV